MGINISATNFVTLDHTHQKRVDTSLENNPTFSKVGGIHVHHVFRRNNDGDKDRDGNPLIKALKGMGQFKILPMYRTQIMDRAREILENFAVDLDIDAVMPMPSSYPFASEVAELVCHVTQKEPIEPSFIRKRTVGEMLDEYDGNIPANLNKRRAKMFKDQLYDWRAAHQSAPGQLVAMKRIEPKIRYCFQPLALSDGAPDIGGRKVLVVDDLMSSGSSIRSVSSVLVQGTGCTVTSAVCFLSGL